ncbi:MAG: hypothetical protein VX400_06885, partial [Pseudomonadota bacterium]|nr:hypothetical protein [Pseudomonadota bacterium]
MARARQYPARTCPPGDALAAAPVARHDGKVANRDWRNGERDMVTAGTAAAIDTEALRRKYAEERDKRLR